MIEWCSALEWPAAGLVSDLSGISIVFVDVGTREHDIAFGCSSGSIFPGRFVHRLLPDCDGVLDWNGIVMSVLRVCRSGCVWIAVGVCCAVVSVSWIPTTCMGGRLRPCSILGGPRVHELWLDSRIALGLLCDSGL